MRRAMPKLQVSQLKLAGEMPHIFAGSSEQLRPACGQFCGFGLREIAAIAHHDPVVEPAGQEIKELAIIDGGGSQIKATEPSGLITLHVEFKAILPAPCAD